MIVSCGQSALIRRRETRLKHPGTSRASSLPTSVKGASAAHATCQRCPKPSGAGDSPHTLLP